MAWLKALYLTAASRPTFTCSNCQQPHPLQAASFCRHGNYGQQSGQFSIVARVPGPLQIPRTVKVLSSGPQGPTSQDPDVVSSASYSSLDPVGKLPQSL
jgi:hypothetical protein